MKKVFSLILAVCCIFSSSVVVFAAPPDLVSSVPIMSSFDGTDTHIGVFKSSQLADGDPIRDFMLEWCENMAGYVEPVSGVDYMLTVHQIPDAEVYSFVRFSSIPSNTYRIDSASNVSLHAPYLFNCKDKSTLKVVLYNSKTKVFIAPSSYSLVFKHVVLSTNSDYFSFAWDSSVSNTKFDFNKHGVDWTGDLILDFDDDINSPSENPDLPSSSSLPPLPPVDPPTLPEIPKGDGEYVVYDTTKWKDFLNHLMQSVGSSATVGFTIFAVICGILLMIKIVKIFSRT